ncbi:hypothetical protein D3C85_1172110 [compost metagenome]
MAQTFLTHQHAGRKPCGTQVILQGTGGAGFRHDSEPRNVTHTKGQQLTQTGKTAQGKDLISIRMTSDDIEGAQTNRAGRAQNGNLLRAAHGAAIHSSTANTGMAAVRLSIRSSTPP